MQRVVIPKDNLILDTDSYKPSQFLQYPKGTEYVNSYIEARSSKKFTKSVFFGLQMFLKRYLIGSVVTQADIDQAERYLKFHGVPFNLEGWQYIVDKYDGCLPVEIEAVPEGTYLENKNVLLQIRNTDPKCFWLTSYLETMILRGVWYPTTVATQSKEIKNLITEYLTETADNLDGLAFKLHDFGYRGVSAKEAGRIGGLAHLVNFMGSDTLGALEYAEYFYNTMIDENQTIAFSIPASEHSTMTTYGREGEVEAFRNMINSFKMNGGTAPRPLFACVSDSYNIFDACEKIWGGALRQDIIDSGSILVVRPDSGEPVSTVTRVVEILAEKFGTTVNSKGYKMLNNVRVIQGDGVNIDSIKAILDSLKAKGYSADNMAFGMGGALLQNVNRDTLGFSMKCNEATIDEETVDVFKQPVGCDWKISKKGRLALLENNGVYTTQQVSLLKKGSHGLQNQLRTVFRNGELLVDEDFATIRARSN